MCTTCGCASGEVRIEGEADGWHTHADGTTHRHAGGADHPHDGAHEHGGDDDDAHDAGHEPLRGHSHGHSHPHDPRLVRIERDILSKNDAIAAANREALAAHGVFALNLVSSPGSGKTTLLVRTARELAARVPIAVIEGDQQTSFDADRIRATGVPALQINTGKGCHLDAAMVRSAMERLPVADDSLLLVENVGNLVCPAAFDLGEAHKVVVLSVTEGEDKPLKYPDMFAAASLMLLNKCDLLPHLDFDVERCIAYARRVNPRIEVMLVSATRGTGFDAWIDWLEQGLAQAGAGRSRPQGLDRAAQADRAGAAQAPLAAG